MPAPQVWSPTAHPGWSRGDVSAPGGAGIGAFRKMTQVLLLPLTVLAGAAASVALMGKAQSLSRSQFQRGKQFPSLWNIITAASLLLWEAIFILVGTGQLLGTRAGAQQGHCPVSPFLSGWPVAPHSSPISVYSGGQMSKREEGCSETEHHWATHSCWVLV